VAKKTIFEGFQPGHPTGLLKPHLVAVVAFDGVVLGDLATPCEIFGRVRDSAGRPCYEVRICSLRQQVKSEHLTLKIPWRLPSIRRAKTVIIPGVNNLDTPVPRELIRALRWAVDHGRRVASICTGAFVLAQTGALNGLTATTHWLLAKELVRRHPEIFINADVLYVDNGNVLTSAGAAAGLDLCLHLVRRDFGAETAAHAARLAVMPLERAGGQAQFIVHESPVSDTSMAPLLLWIEGNLRRSLSLPVIARRAAMSSRTLSRRFSEQVGTTPARWITLARIRRAQRLLETTKLSVEQVATETGFRSATVLREHFSRIVGTAPTNYRGEFSLSPVLSNASAMKSSGIRMRVTGKS
jgi:transcriptional regulator GlxA family with amidase domain